MEKRNRKKDVFLFVVLLLFVASMIFSRDVDNLDEIWNFNFANCMANGLIPYRDFNIIQGPLLPAICSIFLKIFGQEMIVMRVLAVVMDTFILWMIYKVMSTLKIKEYLKNTILIILFIIMNEYFTIDYNWATLLILLIILNIELKNENKSDFKRDLLVGILAGITIAFKQTTGLIISVVTIGYSVLAVRSKEDFKDFIKKALYRLLGVLIVVCLMLVYLIINGAFYDYIDYCFLGINTFSNEKSYLESIVKNENILISILSLLPLINLLLIYLYFKQKKYNFCTLFVYSIISMVFVYPIADGSHFVIALVPTLISFFYLVHLWAEKNQVQEKEQIIVQFLSKAMLTVISFVYFIEYIIFLFAIIFNLKETDYVINTELNHYKYLSMSQSTIDSVKEIDEYIESQEKDVIILDATAAYYMIPIGRYHKNYDMFLKGNLGSRGEEGQIEDIKNLENIRILIMNDAYSRNWQNPEEVREYIQSNMTKVGEIGCFDIYE